MCRILLSVLHSPAIRTLRLYSQDETAARGGRIGGERSHGIWLGQLLYRWLPAALLDGIAPHQVLSASPGLEGKRDKQQPPDRFRAVRPVKLTVAPFVQVL